jgi:proline iminopeptidase
MTKLDRRGFLRLGTAAAVGAASAARRGRAESPAARPPSREVKTGGIRMIPVDGKYRVWTKKVGPGRANILTLHGGPGVTHEYLECFEDFLPQAGYPYFYYDQLGSAYSDQPDDPKLWTVERFREEVGQVRSALGLENFHLYGQSWGGMLGIEYALKYQKHLKSLVISNMTASIASYVRYINELRAKLPKEIIATLEKYEAKGEYEAPEYQEVMFKQIYARHLCRLDPWPDPVERAFKHLNPKVYNTMQGPNEFVVNGTFKDWDRWKDLREIRVPTLLLVGRYDTMSVADIQKMGKEIPNSRVAVCENGSHLSEYDDQEAYFRHLLGFWKQVDAGRFVGPSLPLGS